MLPSPLDGRPTRDLTTEMRGPVEHVPAREPADPDLPTHATPLTDRTGIQNATGLSLPLSIFSGNTEEEDAAVVSACFLFKAFSSFAPDSRRSFVANAIVEYVIQLTEHAQSLETESLEFLFSDHRQLLAHVHAIAINDLTADVAKGVVFSDDDDDFGEDFVATVLNEHASYLARTLAPATTPAPRLPASASPLNDSAPAGGEVLFPSDGVTRPAPVNDPAPATGDVHSASSLLSPERAWPGSNDLASRRAAERRPTVERADLQLRLDVLLTTPPTMQAPERLFWADQGQDFDQLVAYAVATHPEPFTTAILRSTFADRPALRAADHAPLGTGPPPSASLPWLDEAQLLLKREPPLKSEHGADLAPGRPAQAGPPPPSSRPPLSRPPSPAPNLPAHTPPAASSGPPLTLALHAYSPVAVLVPPQSQLCLALRLSGAVATGSRVCLDPLPPGADPRLRTLGLQFPRVCGHVDLGPIDTRFDREVLFVWGYVANNTHREVTLPAAIPCCTVEPAPLLDSASRIDPPAQGLRRPATEAALSASLDRLIAVDAPRPAPPLASPPARTPVPLQQPAPIRRSPTRLAPGAFPARLPNAAPRPPAPKPAFSSVATGDAGAAPYVPPTWATHDERAGAERARATERATDEAWAAGVQARLGPPQPAATPASDPLVFNKDTDNVVTFMCNLPTQFRMSWLHEVPEKDYGSSAVIAAQPYADACVAAIYDADELAGSPFLTADFGREQIEGCILEPSLYLLFRAQFINDLVGRWFFAFGSSLLSRVPLAQCRGRSDASAFRAAGDVLATIPALHADWRSVQSLATWHDKLDTLLRALDGILAPPLGQNPGATLWRRLDLVGGEDTMAFLIRTKGVASLQQLMTPALFRDRVTEIASDVDAEVKSTESAAFLAWCRALDAHVTPADAVSLIRTEHIHRVALRPAPPASPPPSTDTGEGLSFPSRDPNKIRGNNIVPLYEAHGLTPQPVQIAACEDPRHPCSMCYLKNRPTVQFDTLPNGDRPRPPAGGCFIHGAYRCPKYADDLRDLHAAKPELGLDVAALLEKIDPLVIYRAYCVKENIVPRSAPRLA